jgi:imidazolonepropionase-like amidohydrolase
MRRAGCAYSPALGSVLNAYAPAPLGAWLRSFPAAQALGATVLAQADEPQAAGLWLMHWTRQGIDPATVRLAAKGMADAGVRIVFGTGSGLPLVFHGLGAQAEVALLLQAGLSPRQILESATLNSHALAGLEGGSLRKGDPADVLLVSGDPVRDASVATHPVRVFLGGVETAP